MNGVLVGSLAVGVGPPVRRAAVRLGLESAPRRCGAVAGPVASVGGRGTAAGWPIARPGTSWGGVATAGGLL